MASATPFTSAPVAKSSTCATTGPSSESNKRPTYVRITNAPSPIAAPATLIGPHPQWNDPAKIVSLDPWGHLVGEVFAEHIRAGIDIRPTIAVTRARIMTPALRPLLADGTLRPDGEVLLDNGEIRVTKAAIDSVWHLSGLAARFGVGSGQ